MITGSEEGWAAASHDSRREAKQRDIKALTDKMMTAKARKQAEWEQRLGEEIEEATMPVVLKGGVNCVGYSRQYAANYDRVFGRTR